MDVNLGDIASVAGTGISLVALGAASWLSVRAARAAEKSAEASRRAAAASEASVSVAVESLGIARKQAEVAERQANKADSPVFRLEMAPMDPFECEVTAELVDGPHTIGVEMEADFSIDFEPGGSPDTTVSGHDSIGAELHLGETLGVYSTYPEGESESGWNHFFQACATVTIDSQETEEPFRSWRMVQVVNLDPVSVDKWFGERWGRKSEEQ